MLAHRSQRIKHSLYSINSSSDLCKLTVESGFSVQGLSTQAEN